jgi:alcohol dehydrogenase
MKAAIYYEHGNRDVIRIDDIPVPQIADDEILVEVKACGLNHLDVFCRKGMPDLPIPLPHISGGDIAGVVAKIGSAVTNVKIGDRVMLNPRIFRDGKKYVLGETTWGGLCQYCRTTAESAIPIPEGVTFEQAAALPIAYGTAWRMMVTRGRVQVGEKVLVLGAAGGVGVACVQIAKMAGAEVIAAASSWDKLERLKALGADTLVNYTETPEWHRTVRSLTNGEGVDVVVDYTGADTWVKSLKAVKKGGRILTCGATTGYDPKTDIRYIWTREIEIVGSNGWANEDLVMVLEMVRRGKMEAVIDSVLPLEQTAEGHRILEERRVLGKVLVTP